MSEKSLYTYSDILADDGAFERAKAEILSFEKFVLQSAEKLKDSISVVDFKDGNNIAKYAKELEDLKKVYADTKKAIKDLNALEVEYQRTKREQIKTVEAEIKAERELDKAIQQNNNTKKSAIQLSEQERRQREGVERSARRQKDAYGEMSAELNELFRASASVAVQMFKLEQAGQKASPQYEKLALEFAELQGQTMKLDKAIKHIDASLGRNQRNVGNYASGFDGLSNSINQLSREFPAFAVSTSTGILALSNNFPILVDEVKRLIRVNKEMLKEGKEVVPVMKQIASSVFSFGTALSIGITLLTIYGDEFGEWVEEIFKGSAALERIKEAQEALNKAQLEGIKSTVADERALRSNLKIAQDATLTLEERMIGVKKLRDQYPFYFKMLTDEDILNGNTVKSQEEVIKALNKRGEAEKANEQIIKNKQRILDIGDEEEKLQKRLTAETAKYNKVLNERVAPTQEERRNEREIAALGQKRDTEAEINGLRMERDKLNKQNESYEERILRLQKESIGLDYREEQLRKNALKDQIKSVDYLASEYELRKVILENAIKQNEEIFESDKYSLDQRLDAQKNLVTQSLLLAELSRQESLRILKKTYDEERTATIKDSEGKVIGKKYTNQALLELEKQYQFDRDKILEEYREAEREATQKGEKIAQLDMLKMQQDNLKFLQNNLSTRSDIYKQYAREISAIQTEINKIIDSDKGLELSDKIQIDESELERIRAFRERLEGELAGRNYSSLSKGEREKFKKEIEAFEKERTDIQEDYEAQRRLNRLHSIEQEKKSFVEGSNEFKQLELERLAIEKQMEDDRIKRALDTNKTVLENYKDFTKDLFDLIGKILDKFQEMANKEVETNQKKLDDQEKATDIQRERAQNGLENTLAFEQQQEAKREAALERSRRRAERLEKIRALYSSYTANANNPNEQNPLQKTLRDFAILEAIQASFGDGGLVADKVPTDGRGIVRGRSHQGNGGGIPVMVEREEGFLSRKNMRNLGRENFYALRSMLQRGKVSPDLFNRQKDEFISIMPVASDNTGVEYGLKEILNELRSKPAQSVDAAGLAAGLNQIIEKVTTGNKTIRNVYKIKKPRL